MNFRQWYVSRGRIDRRTFWLHYFLPLIAIGLVLEVIAVLAGAPILQSVNATTSTSGPTWPFFLLLVVDLALAVPSVSSQVTRLHDRGHSAWWLLFNFLPLAGAIVLIVQFCLPGEAGSNSYGPAPAPRTPVPDAPYPALQN